MNKRLNEKGCNFPFHINNFGELNKGKFLRLKVMQPNIMKKNQLKVLIFNSH